LTLTCCLQFSSFDPDVCAMLRSRQQRIPVFFLSTGGSVPHPNPDRMGLDAAINFALRTNLQVRITASYRCPASANVKPPACCSCLCLLRTCYVEKSFLPLQGLVVDTSALRRAPQAAATARSKGLQVGPGPTAELHASANTLLNAS
jgi:hypothetical protein